MYSGMWPGSDVKPGAAAQAPRRVATTRALIWSPMRLVTSCRILSGTSLPSFESLSHLLAALWARLITMRAITSDATLFMLVPLTGTTVLLPNLSMDLG